VKVRVLMFGPLAEAAAHSVLIDDLPESPSTDDVRRVIGERYPAAHTILARCSIAVNLEIVQRARPVGDGDEVALLPPVSGGGDASVHVALTQEPSVERALAATSAAAAGGTAIFVGAVRDSCDDGPVTRLEYSAYDEMAVRVIREIADEAVAKWALLGCAVEHAVGERPAGAITFVVACTAPHRHEAFDACQYVTDEVKLRAPIWKKEVGPWGERWIGL